MRAFVAGASGAIGRPLIRRLVQAGHTPTGMTRRAEATEEIRADGAEAVVVDAFDRNALKEAVARAKPEVVVHELTSYAASLNLRDPAVYEGTNRLRTEGTRNLIEAARAAGASRIVAQSVAFGYAPVGGWVKDEEAPLIEKSAGAFGEAMRAVRDLEHQVMTADGLDGLVLRYGWFYGPGTSYAPGGEHAEEIRRRRFPVIGSGAATYSFVHVDDAAAATAAACERGAPGVYNVTDDEPARVRDWAPAFAEAIGAKPPRRVPKFVVRLVAGKGIAETGTSLRGASNAKAKRELGWEPLHSSWRDGFRESLRSRAGYV
jgi:nucleoside-diphosphate-sugar epimerase